MTKLILPIAALLTGVALLLFGAGLLGTLIAVRGAFEGFGAQTIGLIMSGYFVGFLIGTRVAPPLIRRIGHIRAFAFYAAACASLTLLHALVVEPSVWLLLRVATGVALVGLYTVIESWLNAQAPPDRRGQVFAVYMAVNLFALAAGQQLLRLHPPEAFALFALVAMLISAAVLPVTWTRLPQPPTPTVSRLGVAQVYRLAPAAFAGALLSGVAMSGFWGLGPVFADRVGLDQGGVATLMSVTIVGGALLQWPLGHLSDRVDRRLALALVAGLAALVALAMLPGLADRPTWLLAVFFLYGGVAFTVYPIAVAHLMDRLPPGDMLGGISSLLLIHGGGAAAGPLLAGWLMGQFGPAALPLYFAATMALLAAAALRRWLVGQPPALQPTHFMPMVRTTPAAMELLPDPGETDPVPETAPRPAPPKQGETP